MEIKITALILLIISGCSTIEQSECTTDRSYQNHLGHDHRELSLNILSDSIYRNQINQVRLYVIDSLKRPLECFQYNFSVFYEDSTQYFEIELYDKNEVVKKFNEFTNDYYYKLNHLYVFDFDDNGDIVGIGTVIDTDEEILRSDEQVKELFENEEKNGS